MECRETAKIFEISWHCYREYNDTRIARLVIESLPCFSATFATVPGGGGGYSPKIPIRVCAAQRGRDFGTPYLERGIHFRDVS